MRRSHTQACDVIVAVSEPWKRLNEHVDFRAALSNKSSGLRAYVCMHGNKTAGFVVFIPDPVFARGGYLRAIGVASGFRGRGIGKKLMLFAEKITSRHASHFFLCVSSFNRSAQAFYRKCGYTRVGKLPGLIKPEYSEYIYWKRLKRADVNSGGRPVLNS